MNVSLRVETLAIRRCRRCSREWPGYLSTCRSCAAALGELVGREILLAVPDLDAGWLPARILPVAALALELSGAPARPEALRDAAAGALDQALAALPSSALVRTLPSGAIVAVLAGETLAESAAAAARAVAAVGETEEVEVRAGIGVGLADGAEPLRATVIAQAEQLARAAYAGQRLCSYAAARLLDRHWQFAPTGVLARREQDQVDGTAALEGPKSPAPTPSALVPDRGPVLIGRERELALLDRELARARAGEGRWCTLVAPAGAGKSKLLRAWLARLDRGSVTVAGAAGSPFGQGPRALVDRLLEALAVPPGGDESEPDAARALAAAIERCDHSLILVVDDLHWADGESLAILRRLARVSLHRCLVVAALRSSFLPHAPWLTETAQLLELPPLAAGERADLLRALLPEATAARVRATLAAAPQAGNPLFLEQAAALTREAGAAAALPRSLHETVLRRLELVLARIEARPLPEELTEIERIVGEWLDRLETEDYEDRAAIARYLGLLERIDAALAITGSIAGVPQKRNRRLAAVIERFYAAGFAERVDEIEQLAEVDPAGAARAAAASAERALRTARIDDAERYSELVQRLAHGDERVRALLRLADIRLARGRPARAWHAAAEALREATDDRLRARCEHRLGRAALDRSRPRSAVALLERALARLRPEERPAAQADLAVARALAGDRAGARSTLAEIDATGNVHARLRLALVDGADDAGSLARTAASAVVFGGDAVADLAALVEMTRLLCDAAPDAVDDRLLTEAERAAQRLGSTSALLAAPPKMRR